MKLSEPNGGQTMVGLKPTYCNLTLTAVLQISDFRGAPLQIIQEKLYRSLENRAFSPVFTASCQLPAERDA